MHRNQPPKVGISPQPHGLTMKLTSANLPAVPQFVPEPHIEDVKPDPTAPGVAMLDTAITKRDSSVSQPSSAQPEGDLPATRTLPRPRYVLPPDHATIRTSAVDPPIVATGYTPGNTNRLTQSFVESSQFATTENNLVPNVSESIPHNTHFCEPVTPFWFFATTVNGTRIWWPFSRYDSHQLEVSASKSNLTGICGLSSSASSPTDSDTVVQVEGGRYDVFLGQRIRRSVYWTEPDAEVRRATWFYRAPNENRVLPFSEAICEQLEIQYTAVVERNLWGHQFELSTEDPRGGRDRYVFHNPQSMIQYRMWAPDDDQTTLPQSLPGDAFMKLAETGAIDERDSRLFYVRRGLDEQLLSQLDDGEFRPVDHVYFVVHGIGTVYNLKGHGLVECINALRRTAYQIAQRHFPNRPGRAEFLPIMWHDALHSDATGVDEQLTRITLRSIPKLRQFTNGTLMDILFYTSSKYCQVVLDSVAGDLCRLRGLFLNRNPDFMGGFSIIGHSLGSVVAFDLLAHQNLHGQSSSDLPAVLGTSEVLITDPDVPNPHNGILPFAGFGVPRVTYPQLDFPVTAIFLLGSPLGLFLTARGIHKLSPDYCLPTCPAFYNIFHPFDPVAYRMESLIDPTFDSPAALIPHHKGRKRLHLQFRDELARVGSDLKSILLQSAQATWRSLQEFAFSHRFLSPQGNMERADGDHFDQKVNELTELCSDCNTESDDLDDGKMSEPDVRTRFTSRLNQGRRLDFILQEAPLERFSDYLFALSSHATYWESEDTSLFLLTEIYSGDLASSNSLSKPVDTDSSSLEHGTVSGVRTTAPILQSSPFTENSPMRSLELESAVRSNERSTPGRNTPHLPANPLPTDAHIRAPQLQDQICSSISDRPQLTSYSSHGTIMSAVNPAMIPSDPKYQSEISDFVS